MFAIETKIANGCIYECAFHVGGITRALNFLKRAAIRDYGEEEGRTVSAIIAFDVERITPETRAHHFIEA